MPTSFSEALWYYYHLHGLSGAVGVPSSMVVLPEGPVSPIQTPRRLSEGRESVGDKDSLLESTFKYPYTTDLQSNVGSRTVSTNDCIRVIFIVIVVIWSWCFN